jgi:hypothetical protein
MEYFVNGDIKNELEKGRILTEQVWNKQIFKYN